MMDDKDESKKEDDYEIIKTRLIVLEDEISRIKMELRSFDKDCNCKLKKGILSQSTKGGKVD